MKNLQMLQLNHLLFNVITNNTQCLENVTCVLVGWQAFPHVLLVNQQNLVSIPPGPHMREPQWTFDLLGTLQRDPHKYVPSPCIKTRCS